MKKKVLFVAISLTLLISSIINQTYIINEKQYFADKLYKVDKAYATVDRSVLIDSSRIDNSTESKSESEIDIEIKFSDGRTFIILLSVFAGLFVIAILMNEPKNRKQKKLKASKTTKK